MVFTDANLNVLKERNQKHRLNETWLSIEPDLLDALLNRIECAENMCNYIGHVPDLKNMDWFIEGDRLYKKWLRSKGSGEGV